MDLEDDLFVTKNKQVNQIAYKVFALYKEVPDGGCKRQERAPAPVCAAVPEYHRDHHLPAFQVRRKKRIVCTRKRNLFSGGVFCRLS